MSIPNVQEKNVSEAFSKQARVFDEEDTNNPILQWMRGVTRISVLSHIKKDAHILELNCGTGIDSVFFAQQGYRVTATDIAPGMLAQVNKKIKTLSIEDKINTKQCSFTNIQALQPAKFDYVFSNFGGLNCTQNLHQVIQQLKPLLNPGAGITLVIMPPICLWELSLALKGNFKTAFRRLKKAGAPSNVEGINFTSWYYTPTYVAKAFGNGFVVKEIKALGVIIPPPYLYKIVIKYPRFLKLTIQLEQLVASLRLFRKMGDHFLITVEKK
ncbi:MAG TPA: class I SAM-dependent methyltransferase [Bacteroidia bacterium]|nr:class I SAM-dependent methyltransferase [Bacteroidia bacterium]